MSLKTKSENGYIALIAMLIIVAVTLSIGLSLNILSINEARSGLMVQQSAVSLELADSCIHEAYLRIRRDSGYNGGSLNTDQGSCKITVSSFGNRRVITAESDVNNIIRKLKSSVRLMGGRIKIIYWQELNL